jgi:hypothetical protein
MRGLMVPNHQCLLSSGRDESLLYIASCHCEVNGPAVNRISQKCLTWIKLDYLR